LLDGAVFDLNEQLVDLRGHALVELLGQPSTGTIAGLLPDCPGIRTAQLMESTRIRESNGHVDLVTIKAVKDIVGRVGAGTAKQLIDLLASTSRPATTTFFRAMGIIANCRASNKESHRLTEFGEPSASLIRLVSQPLDQQVPHIEAKESAMSALWIKAINEQRSEGSIAGQPANTLPAAQFSPRKALRC
jgi:hypothetical protein